MWGSSCPAVATLNPQPYSPPEVDRKWGIWGSRPATRTRTHSSCGLHDGHSVIEIWHCY